MNKARRRSVSPASLRIISPAGVVRGTFQRGVFVIPKTFSKAYCALLCPFRAQRPTDTIQASQFELAELLKYINHESRSSTSQFVHLTIQLSGASSQLNTECPDLRAFLRILVLVSRRSLR